MSTEKCITVYSREACIYCDKAKKFLKENEIPFTEVYLDVDSPTYFEDKEALVQKTNHRTFPFIFVGDKFIGGYQEVVRAYNTTTLHDICKTELGLELALNF